MTGTIPGGGSEFAVASPKTHPSGLAEPLAVNIGRTDDDLEIVTLVGELDAFCVTNFREAMAHVHGAPRRLVVFDLPALRFIDSTGLCALVAIVRRLREEGTQVAVSSPSGGVMRVLFTCGFDRVVTIYDSLSQALSTLSSHHG